MIYTQKNVWRKVAELLVVVLVLGVIDQAFQLGMLDWTLNPFLFVILFFSLRYGINIAILSFFTTLVYHVIATFTAGDDLFLLFYDTGDYLYLLFSLLLAVICGLYSSSYRERYESLTYTQDELKDDNKELTKTIRELEESQRVMQEKVLDSEHTLAQIYQVGLKLDQPTPELVRNEAIAIISDLFKADDIAIYHVDSSKRSLRLRVRQGSSQVLPQTVFLSEESSFYQRLFTEKAITLRNVKDEQNAPVIAGPIVYNKEIQEVLIIDQLDFARLTTHEIQIMSFVLDWISNRIEKAREWQAKDEEKQMLPGTNVYYKEAFDAHVAQQDVRQEEYGVPYSTVAIQFDRFEGMSVAEAEVILRTYLREIDIIGFESNQSVLYFLLPGTDAENAQVVEKRIKKALKEKGGTHAG
ncbi:hypothetical protein [Marinococcus halophilus]|uniref:hypothetical protein n=1 Tax=Marinococcus halophilus TaxID=1371 RepID=UPI0009A7873F|nr:hypothetical protein [Marinococcus halophilus]